MSILITGYDAVKKGKTGYRQEVQPLKHEELLPELIDILTEETEEGNNNYDDVLAFFKKNER